MISKKHKNLCTILSYIEHFLILGSTIPIGIASSAIGLKMCAIIEAIKNYKSIIKKKKNKNNKIVLLAKSKLNSIELLVSKALIDSVMTHNECVLINNVLKEYNETKQEIINLKT